MSQKTNYSLFRKGKNFYFSSIFFEPSMRDEVATLYAFVRFIDDLVDRDPPNVTCSTDAGTNSIAYGVPGAAAGLTALHRTRRETRLRPQLG
jgi:phytoene/squalene synthetase